nr:unnamed protein product [Digitaria exilis]
MPLHLPGQTPDASSPFSCLCSAGDLKSRESRTPPSLPLHLVAVHHLPTSEAPGATANPRAWTTGAKKIREVVLRTHRAGSHSELANREDSEDGLFRVQLVGYWDVWMVTADVAGLWSCGNDQL